MKSALTAISAELEAIREAGTWREERIITKGLTLQGIYGRKMDTWHQMSYMVQGGLDLSKVITHRFHYTEFQQGFDAMNSGKSGKVILDWTERR
jgi:threonine 3-dehydrogenase